MGLKGCVMLVAKDRKERSANNIAGKIKEDFGKATGDKKSQTKCKAKQAHGKARNAVGNMKDQANRNYPRSSSLMRVEPDLRSTNHQRSHP